MNDSVLASLKLIYKPLIMYYGEWELLEGLRDIALEKNGKNQLDEFLERFYYTPLNVIFKDEQLARSFKWKICSRLGRSGRTLYFSKKAFLRNVIANADELVEVGGDSTYKEIKKAIRDRKDVYRDVDSLGTESKYYDDIKKEYLNSDLEMEFAEYVKLCKKKYTKLLTGYNAVLDLFDKSLNVDRFIKCFDIDQLYLYTAYSLLKFAEKNYEATGKLDYNVVALDSYRELVDELRKKDNFYNSHILVGDSNVYTIDDLFKEYDELEERANGK